MIRAPFYEAHVNANEKLRTQRVKVPLGIGAGNGCDAIAAPIAPGALRAG